MEAVLPGRGYTSAITMHVPCETQGTTILRHAANSLVRKRNDNGLTKYVTRVILHYNSNPYLKKKKKSK